MSSITIHALDPELDRRLSAKAKEEGKSKNLFVKECLAQAVGLGPYTDEYAEFCGVWTAEERSIYHAKTEDHDRIDAGEW
jgi:hypothetical protein